MRTFFSHVRIEMGLLFRRGVNLRMLIQVVGKERWFRTFEHRQSGSQGISTLCLEAAKNTCESRDRNQEEEKNKLYTESRLSPCRTANRSTRRASFHPRRGCSISNPGGPFGSRSFPTVPVEAEPPHLLLLQCDRSRPIKRSSSSISCS